MGSHILDILRQGIWASLTGGWFYDPHLNIFCNTFHLYLWMFLLAFPLILHLTVPSSVYTWALYCLILAIVVALVKLLNYRLHHMFDTSEVVEEGLDEKDEKKTEVVAIELGTQGTDEALEMSPISPAGAGTGVVSGSQPTSPLSENNNLSDMDNVITKEPPIVTKSATQSRREDKIKEYPIHEERKGLGSRAPLAEMDADDIDAVSHAQGAVGGGTLSLTGRSSDQERDEEDTPSDFDDNSIPTTITTTADVEAEPSVSRINVPTEGLTDSPIKSMSESKCSCDADLSDVSPDRANKIRKPRRKPSRTKSALETSLPSKSCSERTLQSRPSMPARRKMDSMINKDTGVTILRPWSDQTISRTKAMLADEITVIDFEAMSNVAKAFRTGSVSPCRECGGREERVRELDAKAVQTDSKSLDREHSLENFDHSESTHAASVANSSSQPVIRTNSQETVSSSDEAEHSPGEIVLEDTNKVKCKTKLKHKKKNLKHVRPSSAETLRTSNSKPLSQTGKNAKIHSSPTLSSSVDTSVTEKPKDLLFGRVGKLFRTSSDRVPSATQSSQSSTVGLDWLFNSSSDSDSSDSYSVCSPISSSSMSNEDTTLDNSMEYAVLPESETVTSLSSPSTDELEELRKQGAIPKHFNKPLPPLPEPKEEEETKASSPASFDVSDPEDIQRKLIEILNETETSEQLKKFLAVMEAKKSKSSSMRSKKYVPDDEPQSEAQKKDEASAAVPQEIQGETPVVVKEEGDNHSNESKSATPTEASALLPVNTRTRAVRREARKPVRKRKRRSGMSSPPLPATTLGMNSHLAENHEDTTDGATHLFQDESGNWFSYTFGESSAGVALSVNDANDNPTPWREDRWSSSSCASGSMVIVDTPNDDDDKDRLSLHIQRNLSLPADEQRMRGAIQAYVDHLLESGRRFETSTDSDSPEVGSSRGDANTTKHFYKFQFPWMCKTKKFLKIYFDRLALLALLDRNLSVIENIVAVMMAVMVGALGAVVLSSNFYYDFQIFIFCFVMAGCQYSLLKSVQPDAASPMHGYNRVIVFSRPFYFCLCCGLMILLNHISQWFSATPVYIYHIPFIAKQSLYFARDFLKIFLLCFPLIFTAGLLPQVSTFIMYTLEQLDIHIFGGNATVSLVSSAYCFLRSIVASAFLYGICYLYLIVFSKTNMADSDPCNNVEFAQTSAFSIFCAVLVAISYHLSRSAADPSVLWMLIKEKLWFHEKIKDEEKDEEEELIDPLPNKLKQCVSERLQSDLLISVVIMILVFAIHVSTVFIQPLINEILSYTVAGFGFVIHYIIPQLRKEMPWLCCSHPMMKSKERNMFETTAPAKIMWFEKLYIWLRFIERNGMYPVVILCALTQSVPNIICKFGSYFGPLLIVICAMKLLRFAFSNTPKQHMILAFTVLLFKYDLRWASETALIDYFFLAILLSKFFDLYLKMKFVITYIAPWQITWGSAFHAFAQPFSVPHSAMLFLQAGISAFFSTPLNPFLGSAIFITSYIRPVKFWEKDYNTKRVDHSNTRLSHQLERNPGTDDNNLNSIFYEHLTRSLQHSLCGDLLMGRWGNAEQGDCFIMASDSLNALVHIIEMGNGVVTFQLRGLEFRGTYCQQREVEAITEGVEDNIGFCCFEPGHLPHFLSLNAAFNQRWLSWEVVVTKYVLEGYSISDNNAASMVQVFDFRKVLIMYYVQSIIYYTVRSPRLEQWLENQSICEALLPMTEDDYIDVDPTFSVHVDEDYDSQNSGISRKSFCDTNLKWIQDCAARREKSVDSDKDSMLVTLCFALSLLGRRALGTASHNNTSASVEFFLYGLHALFKGDFRITSARDEWVFADMELLRRVVAPAVRMSLKLHQDHFLISEMFENNDGLYDAISNYEGSLVISHEADPAWRNAVLSNTPSLLALRHVFDDGSDEYKVIMLNKRYLTFRIVKVNRECVRGLWAGQQQELIFLRNRNPERGSIQNAKQALRNMINSSCDQPLGYPIYVSPLTTSYSSTNEQYTSVIGGEFIIANVKRFFRNAWQKMRRHCGASCTSGSSAFSEGDIPYSCTHQAAASVLAGTPTNHPSQDIALQTVGNRSSLISTSSTIASKPRSLVTLAGLIGDSQQLKESPVTQKVRITDISVVYDNINLGRRIDVQWPSHTWRNNGGRNNWAGWYPAVGMEGTVVHRWSPCHREILKRSHVDHPILLIQIGDKYVPIGESGVQDLGPEAC